MLVSITGPSGIGKNRLKESLLEHFPQMIELSWMITRPLRDSDLNRVHVTRGLFEKMAQRSEIILVQELFGHLYGIEADLLTRQDKADRLTEFHIENLLKVKELGIDCLSIGLVPVNIDLLRSRLQFRGTEEQVEIEARLEEAAEEVKKIQKNSTLFLTTIEVSEKNQDQVHEWVIDSLSPHLKGGELNETQNPSWKSRI